MAGADNAGRIELTENDLIAALVAAQVAAAAGGGGEGADGLSVFELAQQTGHAERWVRTKLKLLACEGRLVVGKRPGTMLDGRPMVVPVYKLK